MKRIFSILILAGCAIACTTKCGKNDLTILRINYRFRHPINITPTNDTVSVGDTLWLSCNFSDSLYDYNSNKNLYVPNYDFKSYMRIAKIGDKTKDIVDSPGGVLDFTIIPYIGSLSGISDKSTNINILNENGYNKCEYALIPKHTGVYCIFFFNNSYESVISQIPDIIYSKNKLGRAFADIAYYKINNGNTHFNVYKENTKIVSTDVNNPLLEEIETRYTFIVR